MIVTSFENGRVGDSEFMFDWPQNSQSGRFGVCERLSVPSALNRRRCFRHMGDSRFHWRIFIFVMENPKYALFKMFVFDRDFYFRPCEVCCVQNYRSNTLNEVVPNKAHAFDSLKTK